MAPPVVDPGSAVCPLTLDQLVDLIISFSELYNEAAGIELYEY